MRSPRKVCSSGSSQTAHSLPMKVRSRRVLDLSMSSTPAMPLPDRGGAAESSVELLRRLWRVILSALEEGLEPRECGRKPASKDMSGSERGNKISE
jgi:hypothetical protein